MHFGKARVAREGEDVTIVGISRMAQTAERAAATLAAEHGVQAEVIDPARCARWTCDTILASVARTNRCVVVEEGWPHGGVGANLAALITEQAFDDLDAPVTRVTGADVPMPYSKPLEDIAYPHEGQVVAAALSTLGARPGGGGGHRLMGEIVMPRLSDTMEEGTILRWLKRDGEHVTRGGELVEIETDKAAMTYESDQEGVLEIVAPEGATLAIGEVIARVGLRRTHRIGAHSARRPRRTAQPRRPQPRQPAPRRGARRGAHPRIVAASASLRSRRSRRPQAQPRRRRGRPSRERIRASPLARRLAQEQRGRPPGPCRARVPAGGS